MGNKKKLNLPDDKPWPEVLAYIQQCAFSWDKNVRLIGNARASDIARSCKEALSEFKKIKAERDQFIADRKKLIKDYDRSHRNNAKFMKANRPFSRNR